MNAARASLIALLPPLLILAFERSEKATREWLGLGMQALRERYETLTPREREVFAHVVAGRLNKQIAGDIGAAERTVKAHRVQVMEKMGVDSLADLVRAASRLGLPAPGPPDPS